MKEKINTPALIFAIMIVLLPLIYFLYFLQESIESETPIISIKAKDLFQADDNGIVIWQDCMTASSTSKEIRKQGNFAGLCLEQPCNKGNFVCSYYLKGGGTESRILTGEQIDKLNEDLE